MAHIFLKKIGIDTGFLKGIFCTDIITEVVVCHSVKNTLDLDRFPSLLTDLSVITDW